MSTIKRKKLIAGNWKMNKTPGEAKALVLELNEKAADVGGCDIALCVPYIDIPAVVKSARLRKIAVGAQNMHFEAKGAYTGEISADMLKELGVKYVIVGHSERRQYFGDTDLVVNKKLRAVLEAGMTPILCVGETQEQRDRSVEQEFIHLQLKEAFVGVSQEDARRVVIAYEPIWAIGTGKTASAADAQQMCALIREKVRTMYGSHAARAMRILYGGSMKGSNAPELLACPDIDGGLIGGASLKSEDFFAIIRAAAEK